jgi:phytoene synthase
MPAAESSPESLRLNAARAWCRRIAQRSRSSFYVSFLALPPEQYLDQCVLYAYMRHTDDLGDNTQWSVDEKRSQLTSWRAAVQQALQSEKTPEDPLLLAVAELARRKSIPPQWLLDVIAGVESDLAPRRFADFIALERYCYHVAGVVGLCCLAIWDGDLQAESQELAIRCGLAFQLINILRDVREDARQGRVYLPQADLARFGCSEADLLRPQSSPQLQSLIQFEAELAAGLLAASQALAQALPRPGQAAFLGMHTVYGSLLQQIQSPGFDVLRERARVPRLTALRVLWRCICARWWP